ncbi:UNVERIFIED_CONTAM: Leucine-rich repeat receptor-like protein kinase TDR [Sesamum angustifolium]|uniref:Leucine-rich repeat receptor-like protein kinase TDR n=1 Tax=Sesamum angustifolium TaxID=2727405 RepID=A0AAW2PTC4_9LAMI
MRLLGCVSNNQCTMLLYEYMPNGSLDDLLHGKNKAENLVVDWMTRYKIALGVAQGVCYLHHDCDPVVVHRDLKPSNILLDDEMEARVADFGVAKLVQADESMSVIAGSYGYIAPEYAYTLQVDEKSDIYSYGVVLLEILTGKRSIDAEFGDGNCIVDWVKSKVRMRNGLVDVLDKNAGASCASVREEMLLLLRVALLCTSRNPADRPSMRDVVSMLQEAKPKQKQKLVRHDEVVVDFPELQKTIIEC